SSPLEAPSFAPTAAPSPAPPAPDCRQRHGHAPVRRFSQHRRHVPPRQRQSQALQPFRHPPTPPIPSATFPPIPPPISPPILSPLIHDYPAPILPAPIRPALLRQHVENLHHARRKEPARPRISPFRTVGARSGKRSSLYRS
ncbi:unnamed protein product, partial [Closterium sp. NIES-53]